MSGTQSAPTEKEQFPRPMILEILANTVLPKFVDYREPIKKVVRWDMIFVAIAIAAILIIFLVVMWPIIGPMVF